MRKRDILSIYSSALVELFLASLGFAVLALIALQLLARFAGIAVDAGGVLLFAWQGIVLMALWPGQRFWTIRRTASCGHEHSVIGVPSDDDLRLMHHRSAQRIANQHHNGQR